MTNYFGGYADVECVCAKCNLRWTQPGGEKENCPLCAMRHERNLETMRADYCKSLVDLATKEIVDLKNDLERVKAERDAFKAEAASEKERADDNFSGFERVRQKYSDATNKLKTWEERAKTAEQERNNALAELANGHLALDAAGAPSVPDDGENDKLSIMGRVRRLNIAPSKTIAKRG